MTVFHDTGNGWRPLGDWRYASEEELERLLLGKPDLIAPERVEVRTVWARQLSRLGNALDLVGVGSDGSVTIVECKLGRNREERREVVAQVLEYASALWQMPVDEFLSAFTARTEGRRDPGEALSKGASTTQPGPFDLAEWRRLLAENLRLGRFRLIIAVDDMSHGLKRIVDYVNARGRGELKFVALALRRYGTEGEGVIVPELYGDAAPSPADTTAATAFPSLDEQLARAPESMASLVRAVHQRLAETGALEPRSTGQAISYDGRVDGRRLNILQLWPKAKPEADIYLSRLGIEAMGTTLEAIQDQARAIGIQAVGSSLRLRPTDTDRLAALFEILDQAIVSRLDS